MHDWSSTEQARSLELRGPRPPCGARVTWLARDRSLRAEMGRVPLPMTRTPALCLQLCPCRQKEKNIFPIMIIIIILILIMADPGPTLRGFRQESS
jgi:hypothetical protein